MHKHQSLTSIIARHLGAQENAGLFRRESAFFAAGCEALHELDDYGEGLAHASQNLVKDIFAVDAVSLTDPRQSTIHGLSGAPLFFVAHENKIQACVKAFASTSAQWSEAVWAAVHLHDVLAGIPGLLCVARAKHHGKTYVLLASNYVTGTVVDEFFHQVARMPHDYKRVEHVQQLAHIVLKIGSLLGKLHTAGAPFYGVQSLLVKEMHERALSLTLRGIRTRHNFGIDADRFLSSTKRLMHAMEHHEYRYAYLHGDAHPGNFLYNSASDQIFALDLGAGAKTLGGNKEPLGSPFTDYVKMTASMKVRELIGITPHESTLLRAAFDTGYVAAGGRVPTPAHETFYELMEILDFLAWYFAHVDDLVDDAKVAMTNIAQLAATWLKRLI